MEGETLIVVGRGDPSMKEAPLRLEMGYVYLVESRIRDIAHTNESTAPELLAAFNEAWRVLDNYVTRLKAEAVLGKRTLDRERAKLVVDEIPAIIEAKDLPNTRDIRDSLVLMDPTYQEYEERVAYIDATLMLMEGKKKAMEMAYTAVKKIIGGNALSTRRVLNVDPNEQQEPGVTSPTSGFGTPRY